VIIGLPASTTAAGTRLQVSATAYGCRYLVVTANTANTGWVYVGGSNVSSSVFLFQLEPGASCSLPIDRADKAYYDVSVNSEGIKAGYVV
jgi:hypothetical protein